ADSPAYAPGVSSTSPAARRHEKSNGRHPPLTRTSDAAERSTVIRQLPLQPSAPNHTRPCSSSVSLPLTANHGFTSLLVLPRRLSNTRIPTRNSPLSSCHSPAHRPVS